MSSGRSRSSAAANDPFLRALRGAVARVREELAALEALNPVVLIDGRSGAGKTTLARALVSAWPVSGRVQLVQLDSIYPGWDGLAEGAHIARHDILVPHARGLIGVWRRYDWELGELAEAHAVDPALPLIVEGAGILTPRSRQLCDVALWMQSPDTSRRHRALTRDGERFRPHWDRWARQEETHIRAHDPMSLATITVDVP